jgi:hypothetical protein
MGTSVAVLSGGAASMNLHSRRLITIAGIVAISVIGTDLIHGQSPEPPERFTAVALNIGLDGQPQSDRFEMTVTHWFTDDNIEILIAALVNEGPDALLDEIRKTRGAGYLRMPDGMAYDLLFAQSETAEDGRRRVVFLTDFLSLSQAALVPGPIVYGFALIELHLERNGEGDGAMSIAVRIPPRGKDAFNETDEYAVLTVRLQGVRSFRPPQF